MVLILIMLKTFLTVLELLLLTKEKDYGEIRKISIGKIDSHICVVVYTEREDVIRIISARKANQRERRRFYEFINETKTE